MEINISIVVHPKVLSKNKILGTILNKKDLNFNDFISAQTSLLNAEILSDIVSNVLNSTSWENIGHNHSGSMPL